MCKHTLWNVRLHMQNSTHAESRPKCTLQTMDYEVAAMCRSDQ